MPPAIRYGSCGTLQGIPHAVDVGRLRVIDERDAVHLLHEFQAVFYALKAL